MCRSITSPSASACFFLIVWLAATVNFFLPRLGGQDPSAQQLMQQAALGGNLQTGMEDMIDEYNEKFGLNTAALEAIPDLSGRYDPVRLQLLDRQLSADGHRHDRPRRCPGRSVLLTTTTLFSWVLGTLLGAFMGWPRAPKFLSVPDAAAALAERHPVLPARSAADLSSSPSACGCFPLFGGYTAGNVSRTDPGVRSATCSITRSCPPSSIILVSIGGWALGMRAMMVTTQGEDYVTFADAKGLKGRTIFLRYAIRNALLPQTTALALVLGQLVSGAVLVEVIFSYPGHRHRAVSRRSARSTSSWSRGSSSS